jgi:hypothetical protein
MLNKLYNWHRDYSYKWIDILKLDSYEVAWIGFGKGVLLVLILQWIF